MKAQPEADEPQRMTDGEFWERLVRLLLACVYLLAKWKRVSIKRKAEEEK
jgi:hypothetical protein